MNNQPLKPLSNSSGLLTLNITNDLSIHSSTSDRSPTPVRPAKPQAKPLTKVLRLTGEAIQDFNLIADGDRVLVALSGGKDSMTLLHVLLDLQRRAPIKFTLAAATIDPQMPGYDPLQLSKWVTSLGIDHHLQSYSLGRHAHGSLKGKSLCSFCARLRRGKLQGLAHEHGYNVIALGHHLDDAAETFLMNSFFGGKLRSMRASYLNDDGDLRIVRPLIYVREQQAAENAKQAQLPLVADNCPACEARPTQRNAMKALLENLEQDHPNLFGSLKTTLRPLLAQAFEEDLPTTVNFEQPAEHPVKFMSPASRQG